MGSGPSSASGPYVWDEGDVQVESYNDALCYSMLFVTDAKNDTHTDADCLVPC